MVISAILAMLASTVSASPMSPLQKRFLEEEGLLEPESESQDMVAINEHVQGGNACECLPWKDAYANYGVKCGQGGELNYWVKKLPKMKKIVGGWKHVKNDFPEAMEDVCTNFFERRSDNLCVSKEFMYTVVGPTQWCYVSDACEDETAGLERQFGTTAKTKYCGLDHGDPLSFVTSFDQLYNMSKSENLDLGLLAKYSYRYFHQDPWSKVEAQMMREQGPDVDVRGDLYMLARDSKPTIFFGYDGVLPYHLTFRDSIYEIREGGEMVCIKGCDKTLTAADFRSWYQPGL